MTGENLSHNRPTFSVCMHAMNINRIYTIHIMVGLLPGPHFEQIEVNSGFTCDAINWPRSQKEHCEHLGFRGRKSRIEKQVLRLKWSVEAVQRYELVHVKFGKVHAFSLCVHCLGEGVIWVFLLSCLLLLLLLLADRSQCCCCCCCCCCSCSCCHVVVDVLVE